MRIDGRRPLLIHLKNSDTVCQYADTVLIAHRPGLHDEKTEPNETELILAQHPWIVRRIFNLKFKPEYSNFTDQWQSYKKHGLPEELKNQCLRPAVKMYDVRHIRHRSGNRQTSGVAVDGVPGLFSGTCRRLVKNEHNQQVPQGQKTLE